jgi:mRNA interferase MazF
MAINEHPLVGAVVLCDFNSGFRVPEMVKRRPAIVLSPKIFGRPGLCTVVALSTDPPDPVMPYHKQINLDPLLPAPWDSEGVWVKGDMINAVGFHRLDLVRLGKDRSGKRKYLLTPQCSENIKIVRKCVLTAIGLSVLTKHLP